MTLKMLHLLGDSLLMFFVAVAISVIVGVPTVVGILAWCASGRLDAVPAACFMLLAAGLWVGGLYAPWLWASIACLCVLLLGAAYAVYTLMMEGPVGMGKLLNEQLERYADAVRFNPKNIPARTHLAQTLHQLGRFDEAIDHMDYAVRIASPTVVAQDKITLQRWLKEKKIREVGLIVCRSCFAENPPETAKCESCGASLRGSTVAADWLRSAEGLRFVVTALGAAAIAGAGWLLSKAIPGGAGLLIAAASVALALVFFLVRVGKRSPC